MKKTVAFALLLGCCVSLVVSGRLTARLVLGSTVAWSFIPALEVTAFAIVRRRARSIRTFACDLDLFSAGRRPWAIFLVALAAAASFLTPLQINHWSEATVTLAVLTPIAAGVALRSGYLDFCFYRDALGRPPAEATRDALLQRAICWTAALVYFFGYAGWPDVVDRIGL
jgi:hypothetical protein